MSKKTVFFFIFFFAILLFSSVSVAKTVSGADLKSTPFVTNKSDLKGTFTKIIHLNERGFLFDLYTSTAIFSSNNSVSISGLDQYVQEAGAPALPYFSTFVAVPPSADVAIEVVETAVSQHTVSTIQPAPQPDFSIPENVPDHALSPYTIIENGEIVGYQPLPQIYAQNQTIYQTNAFYPQGNYTLSAPQSYRDYRLVELRLYPLRYNPVTQQLTQAKHLSVNVTFTGANMDEIRPLPSHNNSYQQGIASLAINHEQAKNWRSVQNLQPAATTQLPIGTETYKIEINQDGIYEITGQDLQDAGMNIAVIDPNTIEMLYRGQPHAYQFIDNNGNDNLDTDDIIRFYGWAFEGSRAEKRFIQNNVYWLWAGGTPTLMSSQNNETDQGHSIDENFLESITREPENSWFATWTDDWETFPNEPDDFFWDYIKTGSAPITKTYTMTIHHPDINAGIATYTSEFQSKKYTTGIPHEINVFINDHDQPASGQWEGVRNVNIQNTLTLTDTDVLTDGVISFTVAYNTPSVKQIYLNRITLDYLRQYIAINDQLMFTDESGGAQEFQISSYSESNVDNVLIWDITVPTKTVQIDLDSGDIVDDGGSYTYKVASTHDANSKFIATTQANVLSANELASPLSQYIPQSLDPNTGGADWLAISHANFMTATNYLANYRGNVSTSPMLTHTVDIEDVINQYGYGLPSPEVIRDFLRYTAGNWSPAPSYVTLVGDATQNPKNLDCASGCSGWDKDEVTFVLTDLLFVDRFQGLIPTDHSLVLLGDEDDLLADMAIGRLPVKTEEDAYAIVNKIIQFEQAQLEPENNSWQQNILFVADKFDPAAGNFCAANAATEDILPDFVNDTQLCIDPDIGDTKDVIREAMTQTVNITGTAVLNYRGHGGRDKWGSSFINTSLHTQIWENEGKPFLLLSADCLDGHFAWPSVQGLGETFLRLDNRGSVAHWGSSGLGFTSEHSVLHQGFYKGVFDEGLVALGDSANHAKLIYYLTGSDPSELYGFNLEGDPAMSLFRSDLTSTKTALETEVDPEAQASFVIEVTNNGLYPAQVTVTDTLPLDLSLIATDASPAPLTTTVAGEQVRFDFEHPLNWGESIFITITTETDSEFAGITTNWVTAVSSGTDINSENNSASAVITSTASNISLTYFTAVLTDDVTVQLDWETDLEFNIDAYRIQRAIEGGTFEWLDDLGTNGLIPAQGQALNQYQEFDTTAERGNSYKYRLWIVQTNGSEVNVNTQQVTIPIADNLLFLPFMTRP